MDAQVVDFSESANENTQRASDIIIDTGKPSDTPDLLEYYEKLLGLLELVVGTIGLAQKEECDEKRTELLSAAHHALDVLVLPERFEHHRRHSCDYIGMILDLASDGWSDESKERLRKLLLSTTNLRLGFALAGGVNLYEH